MIRIACILSIAVAACSTGRDVGAPHHPDLSLTKLALEAEGGSKLFRSYQPNGPVLWSQGWTWKLDLTGVAWDRSNTATVITPRHVVMAAHYTRKVGQKLVFHDRTGKRHARTVERIISFKDRGVGGDVAVGLLDSPLPASIRTYPLPALGEQDGASLVGAVALVTEQKRSLYFHQIGSVYSQGLVFRFDSRISSNRRKHLVAGDSGHPSFLLSKGELVLLETHTGGGPGSGPFYGSRLVQKQIERIVEELDPKYSVRTISIDKRALDEAETGREAMPKPPPRPAQASPQPAPPSNSGTPRRPRPRVVRPPEEPTSTP
ncbi:hypothetical protein HAHE_37030 [Haloferula helveola]|uniref:Serine protease n=1 Tax=Haloferula helveola TaxID=490095 RepID=A0ABM7RR01_9BACT|nr:hypothetical protein HAHE_37030 [Haloferula helveola]